MKKARLRKRLVNKAVGQPLTARESEVLWLVADGLSNKVIANQLHLSEHTVKFHLRNAGLKIGTSSRTKIAVDFCLWQGHAGLVRIAPASGKSEFALQRSRLLQDNWNEGFAAALAAVLRNGGGLTKIYAAAREAGFSLPVAIAAGGPSFDLDELKRARVP